MRRLFPVLGVLLLASCLTQPHRTAPYFLGVSTAEACGPVYVRNELKRLDDGNTYTIQWMPVTNTNSHVPGNAYIDADLSSNRWPVSRFHLDLAVDGSNYTRRIGYGVQTSKDGMYGEMVWSPPLDYSLLSETARIRAVGLDGQAFHWTRTNFPTDFQAGQFITSAEFTIAGIDCLVPDGTDLTYHNAPLQIVWRQAGAGSVVNVYWITPTTVSQWAQHPLVTLSNCVCGTNTVIVNNTIPTAASVELVFISKSDPNIIGYSQTFDVEP